MSDNKLAFYDFSGGINTSATKAALGSNNKKVPWDESFNVELYKEQGVKRMAGNQKLLETQEAAKILAIMQYPKDTEDFVFAQSDGKIKHYKSLNGTATTIYDFEENIESAQFVCYLDGVVVLCKGKEGFYYNQNASTKIKPLNAKTTGNEPLLANCGCSFAGRVWLCSASTLYYSALGRFDDWESANDAGYIANFHSSTTEITALEAYCGSLAIYKTDGVYLLGGTSPSDFAVVKFADKGTNSKFATCTCNNKQYFFNADGVFSLSQVGELSQIMMSGNIANNIKEEFQNCDRSRMEEAFCVPFEKNNQIWFYLPKIGKNYLNEILIYDFLHQCWTKRREPQKITTGANVYGEVVSGTQDGKILLENKGNNFDGAKIEFKFSTPFFHLGKPSERKMVEDFALLIDDDGENRFTFSTTKDFIKDERFDTERVKISQKGALVWAGVDDIKTQENSWGDANSGAIWARIFECAIGLQIFNSNYSVAIHIEGENDGDDFKLVGIEFKELLDDC